MGLAHVLFSLSGYTGFTQSEASLFEAFRFCHRILRLLPVDVDVVRFAIYHQTALVDQKPLASPAWWMGLVALVDCCLILTLVHLKFLRFRWIFSVCKSNLPFDICVQSVRLKCDSKERGPSSLTHTRTLVYLMHTLGYVIGGESAWVQFSRLVCCSFHTT